MIFISVFRATTLSAQHTFPISDGEKVKYNAMIQMPNAYISGVCVLLNDCGVIKGCMFNEFGITMLDFSFSPDKQKVKLHHVIKMMDKAIPLYQIRSASMHWCFLAKNKL